MHRTGRSANMLSSPSTDRNSAGLNLSELQRGHSRRIHTKCGTQLGHLRFEKFISTAPNARKQGRCYLIASGELELASSQASDERMLPVARAIDESDAP